jgi:16S rRNA (cytosine1402-N4)-methyltransferase
MEKHISVLLDECLEGLAIKPDGTYVDCTLGMGGHSKNILARIPDGFLYGFDQDTDAIKIADNNLKAVGSNYEIIQSNFVSLQSELEARQVKEVDGFLFDLGVSSLQFDEEERGFSYRFDARLDMRMNREQALDGFKVVNEYDYHKLVKIFYEYGEEKFATSIARNIEKQRKVKPIETTFELVDVIKASLPEKVKRKKGHPAKKVFQAIRIEVNDELNVFRNAIEDAIKMTKVGGRICVITFHSLEDRICKQVFKKHSVVDIPKGLPIVDSEIKAKVKLITRKPITSTEEELENNNRAHSAKLRICEVQL